MSRPSIAVGFISRPAQNHVGGGQTGEHRGPAERGDRRARRKGRLARVRRIFMITSPSALVSRGAFTALPEERSRDRSISHAVPRRCRGRHVHFVSRTHLRRPDRSWDRKVQKMLIRQIYLRELVCLSTLVVQRARIDFHTRGATWAVICRNKPRANPHSQN